MRLPPSSPKALSINTPKSARPQTRRTTSTELVKSNELGVIAANPADAVGECSDFQEHSGNDREH